MSIDLLLNGSGGEEVTGGGSEGGCGLLLDLYSFLENYLQTDVKPYSTVEFQLQSVENIKILKKMRI